MMMEKSLGWWPLKNFFRFSFILVGSMLVLLIKVSPLCAYMDQVTVKAPEAWEAAKEVFRKTGFKKIDEKKYRFETKWIEDEVTRSRGLLKGIASQKYQRRYRISVEIRQREYDSEIEIHGTFQERPLNINQQYLMTWQTVHPETEDYEVERQGFMRILGQLQFMKMGQNATV